MWLSELLSGWKRVAAFSLECSQNEIAFRRQYYYDLPKEQIGVEDLRLWLGYDCSLVRYIDTDWGREAYPTAVEILPTARVVCEERVGAPNELGFALDDLGNCWRCVSELTSRSAYKWKGHMLTGRKHEGMEKYNRLVLSIFPSRPKKGRTLHKRYEEWSTSVPNMLIASSLCVLRHAIRNISQGGRELADKCAWYLYQGLNDEKRLRLRKVVELQNKAFFAAMAGPGFVGERWEEWKG